MIGCGPQPRLSWEQRYDQAYLTYQRGDLTAALAEVERADRDSAAIDPSWNYKFKVLKAEILAGQGRAKEAMDLLAPDPPALLAAGEFGVRRKVVQGRALCQLRQFSGAQLRLNEAEQLAATGAPGLLGEVMLNRGTWEALQGNYAASEKDFSGALSFSKQRDQPFLEANALGSLGYADMHREHYDKALRWFERALLKARTLHAHRAEQKTLGNMGWSYFQIGDFDQSLSFLQQAESAAARQDMIQDQQHWSTSLGNVYLSRGDYPLAQVWFSKARNLAEKLNNSDLIVLALHNLAQLELARENPEEAEKYNRKAFAAGGLGPEDRSDPYLVLTTAEIAKARRQFSQAEELLLSVIGNKESDSSLRWQAQSDLANVYVAQSKFPEAEREFQKALEIVERASGDVKQEERRMSILDAWPFYDDYVRFLVDRNNPAKALQIAEFSRARTLAEAFGIKAEQRAAGLSIAGLQRSLGARNQIVLAYWLADKESYLWAITPSRFQLFHLRPRNEIEAAIASNATQIGERLEPQDSQAAQQLYALLVKPAAALIPGNARVVIAPSRDLYKLNFETLVVPGAKPHYWIEDVQVENASSLALLAAAKRSTSAANNLLLIGAPLEASKDFPALKYAPEEMQKVGSHFPSGRVTTISGRDAIPQAYRASRPGQYRLIHFVSHGTPNQMSPLDSAIILSADADNSFKLYARDIISASQKKEDRLHANLVTISACYGMGNKTYSGEGLVGLAWAFMRAGAHQVIAGLWEVDDASSPQLMDDFYSELGKGKSAAEALRHAKLNMLGSGGVHRWPRHWASLQVYTGS